MTMIVGKGAVREMANEIDKVALQINEITQSKIDRVSDKIDSELNSCGRELTNAKNTLIQVRPLVERLVQQVGANAPDHVQVLVQSITTEIMSKVLGSIDNLDEVQKNIKDVDNLTNTIDSLTDEVSALTKKIDSITDKYQG
jgi:methyl-accepting chemotaxis protein